MCGIFGAATTTKSGIDLAAFVTGLRKMRHRGPDDEGIVMLSLNDLVPHALSTDESAPGVGLPRIETHSGEPVQLVFGHRRLSILDLSPLGHQPMGYDNERYWMTFNGEVYNFEELRSELKGLGHKFNSESDTEVVLAAFAQWGTECFKRLIGMFALAIFDRESKHLTLARDHFGIKPLCYAKVGDTLVFGSEIKALFEYPGLSRKANAQALYDYLRFGLSDHSASTFFESVFELPARHFAVVDLNGSLDVNPVPYWSIDLSVKAEISFEEAVATLRDLLADSVKLHMRSDVPVGACLSGGLDSTAIVAHMLGGDNSGVPTFTYVADDAVLSEAKWVDIATARYGVENFRTQPSAQEIADGLPGLTSVLDQPFGGWSMFAQYKVFELAKKHEVTVVLDGQGSDELFGGYASMLGARASGMLAQGRVLEALALLRRSPENLSAYKRQLVLMSFGRLLPRKLQPALMKMVGSGLYPVWMNQSYFENEGVIAQQRPSGKGADALRQELKIALEEISLPKLLRYEDRNSMHFSIESRVPFCNPKIAEFAFSLPPEYLVSNQGETKYVLREAMRGIVPDSIIDREKVGFAVPERKLAASSEKWIQEQIQLLNEMNLPFLNGKALGESLTNYLSSSEKFDLGQFWRPINVAMWIRRFGVELN